MYTYQDFKQETQGTGVELAVRTAITRHKSSELYRIAEDADLYDKQRNKTIHEYVRVIFSLAGTPVEDFTASNNKIASNFFHRLNTQRCTYSLGNGVTFNNVVTSVDEEGLEVAIDTTKERLGPKFDTDLFEAGYHSLIHGVSFGFWNLNRLFVFPVTEFAPLWDEETGALRAGVRFWQVDSSKPTFAVLYEEDGYTKFKTESGGSADFVEVEPKTAYKRNVQYTKAEGEIVVGEDNYSALPIVPYWGSRLRQSTLVGMQQAIDSFDLIRSGFANDLTDCAQIYWLIENYGGMTDADLAKFRDRMRINHIVEADTSQGGKVTPYTQDIPYQARETYLKQIRAGIYEDFGGLDVHTVAAGATNDHIDAAYQPMDENADDFEYQTIEFVQQILALNGIEDTPNFKRNRISNQREQVEMLVLEAPYLDDETILRKLPNISPDEIQRILARKDAESASRFGTDGTGGTNEETEESEESFSG